MFRHLYDENVARNMVRFHSVLTGDEKDRLRSKTPACNRAAVKRESAVAIIKEALTHVLRNKPDKPLEFLRSYFINLRQERQMNQKNLENGI